jgi:5-methylcytosine-specific restriction endonuclease McrA
MQSTIEETVLVDSRTLRSRFRQSIFQNWNYECAYCGEPAKSLDHVQPKMKGGLTIAKNLAPACLSCNRKKGHREVFSWWREQPYWSEIGQAKLIDWLTGRN